jgi:transcriptional regulator with XRE-family HTH domain
MLDVVGVDANKLQRLRFGLGLSQQELAEKAKVSPDTIVRWEKGRGTRPHARAIKKLADALGVTPNDLLED